MGGGMGAARKASKRLDALRAAKPLRTVALQPKGKKSLKGSERSEYRMEAGVRPLSAACGKKFIG